MKDYANINDKDEYIPCCYEAFIPKFTEGSRHQRRQELLELDDLNKLVYRVEEIFYNFVFDQPKVEYKDAYVTCLKLYKDVCNYIKSVKKPKWYRINENYFYEQFAPVELIKK